MANNLFETCYHTHNHPSDSPGQDEYDVYCECILKGLVSPQASGVKVTEEVIAVFNNMKVRKAQANEEEKRKRKKAILFCMSKDLKNIVLDDGKEILMGDLGTTIHDPYQHFVKMLPADDCRYALYDATYETKETKKEDLVFIFWWGGTSL